MHDPKFTSIYATGAHHKGELTLTAHSHRQFSESCAQTSELTTREEGSQVLVTREVSGSRAGGYGGDLPLT